MQTLNELQQRLQHSFNDVALLKQALTHRSASVNNNERLEFLGDAVLSFIIADELYKRQTTAQEGTLSRLRSGLVNGEILATMARSFGINRFIFLGTGEKRSGGENRDSILADAMEAIMGAIYLDSGMEVCRQCVLLWYGQRFDDLSKIKPKKDAKSMLQEWLQAHELPLPEYEARTAGAAHAQTFFVTCRVAGMPLESQGQSSSRRRAEQEAAIAFLALVRQHHE